MALKDILKKMIADTAKAQAAVKSAPSPTQQIMSNIKQTISAPPKPSVVGRVVDQIRQVQPAQAPVKPVQYPNTQLRQQTDQESMLGTLRAKAVEASTPKPFFSPVSKPIYFPAVGAGAASDVGEPKRLNEILSTLPMAQVARDLKEQQELLKKFPSVKDVGNIYKKKVDGIPLTPDEQRFYDLQSKTAQLAIGMTGDIVGTGATKLLKSKGIAGLKTDSKALFDPDVYVKEQLEKRKAAQKAGDTGKPGVLKTLYNDAKSKLVDFAAPIEDTLATAVKKGYKPEGDITNQIDRVLRSPTIAGQFVRDNGLDAVIRSVDNLDSLDQYLIAKHAQTLETNGIKTGRDLAKDQSLIDSLAPSYDAPAKQVTAYAQKLLDYGVDSGLISKDLATKLKQIYPDYVPMNRVFSEIEKSGGGVGKAIASLSKQSIVQKIIGSERQIESPLNSMLSKTADAFAQGEKNKAAKIVAGFKDIEGNPFKLRELKKGESAPNTISFLDNGEKRIFETSPEIASAAKSLNVQQLNILGKIFALPVRIAKVGITGLNIPFIGANIAKDQVTAFINSSYGLRSSIANPKVFTKALFETVKHGKVFDEMAREGAMGTSFDIARNQVPETLAKIRSGKNIGTKILYTVKNPSELLRAVENIIARSEEFTRAKEYIGTKAGELAKGVPEEQAIIKAARAARENTVNFARRGEWGQVLNSAFLYLNAGIQGSRTFLRNLTTKPVSTSAKIALVVFTPVAASTAWNLADPKRKEAYDDMADYEKENNIIFIPPNPTKDANGNWNVIKIPLSQEVNNLAGIVRKYVEQANGKDPVTVKDIASGLLGSVSPVNLTVGSLASTFTPQIIKPSIEALTNTNLFTGIPQVSDKLSKLSPELQVKPNTSGTAIKIGGKLNLSPVKVEEFIKGTFGGVGSQVLNASDRILAGMDIIPKDQIGGQNVVEAILSRFMTARGGHTDDKANAELQSILQDQADESFRLQQEAEVLLTELKIMPTEERKVKAKEIAEKNPKLFAELETVGKKAAQGLTYGDRLINQLQVKNGARAKFIYKSMEGFKTSEEKKSYLKDLVEKDIVSKEVMEQVKTLYARGGKVNEQDSIPGKEAPDSEVSKEMAKKTQLKANAKLLKDPQAMADLAQKYIKAFSVDPESAVKALFTAEQLRDVRGDAVIFERMGFDESEEVKKNGGAGPDDIMDHTVPIELGGDNSFENRRIVTKDEWNSYTATENYLGSLLKKGKITKKEGSYAIKALKTKELTADEIKAKYK